MPTVKYTNGQTESLAFTPLSVYERYDFIDLLVTGRSPQIVELCAHRNAAWVKSLDFASYRELINHCIKENFSMAMEIAQSDPIAGLKVGPLLLQMARLLEQMPAVSLPNPPPDASGAGPSPSSSPTPAPASPGGSGAPRTPPPAAAAAPIPALSAT